MRKRVVAAIAAVLAVLGAYVYAQRIITGPGYSLLTDPEGRCVLAVSSAALPANIHCQDNAVLIRSDLGRWYISSADVWSEAQLGATIANVTTGNITTVNATTQNVNVMPILAEPSPVSNCILPCAAVLAANKAG